tara:strand:- start:187 stop:660 length:474 start_codon:yes stop_codon:yes gene_type:complete
MSQLKVDSIIPRGGLPSGASGGIIQMKTTVKTDTFKTSSNSMVDVTGLSVTITPQSSSNKILCICSLTAGNGQGGQHNKYRIVRGSTSLMSTNQSVRNDETNSTYSYSSIVLDSPNTTSATTYKIQILAESNEVFVNRNGSNNHYGESSIIVFEVGM